MRNCRRLRDDGTIIEEATGLTLLEIQKKVGRFMLSQILPSPLKKNVFLGALRDSGIEIFECFCIIEKKFLLKLET